MLKKQTMYLETSIISAYFDFWKSNLQQKIWTQKFYNITRKKYQFFISDISIAEIIDVKNEQWREKLMKLIETLKCVKLKTIKKVKVIGEDYIKYGIIPKSCPRDALHIAFATHFKIDYLVSWNQKHITRPFKIKQIFDFNHKMVGHSPLIVTPLAFIESD